MHHRHITEGNRRFARKLRREQTRLEARVWHELRGKRLDGRKFKRQVPIEGYVVDFVCFEARLIVEMDGPLHLSLEQRAKDAKRNAVLSRQGFRVLRFSEEVALGTVIAEIQTALRVTPLPTPD